MSSRTRLSALAGALVLLALGPRPLAAEVEIPEPFRKAAEAYLPKAIKTPLGLYRRTDALFRNQARCLAAGGSDVECQAWPLLCDFQGQAISTYLRRAFGAFGRTGPLIAGQLGVFDAFKTTACGDDCFWCCLTPTGCHTSFGPSPKINCNAGYGLGTHTLGRTLITQLPTGTNACLATPQTCDIYAECKIAGGRGYPALPEPPSAYEPPPVATYGFTTPRRTPTPPITVCTLEPTWTPAGGSSLDPGPGTTPELRAAIAQRKARAVAESVVRKTQEVLDELPASYPRDELDDLISYRGCIGHRNLVEHGEPFDGTHDAFGLVTANPAVQGLVSSRRAFVFLAALRVLAGVPNLYDRLAFVESRIWTCPEREAYLRDHGVTDPDGALLTTMSPLALAILKRVDGLQDYRLLAVPLPGEPPVVPSIDGCPLGAPPTVTLAARVEGGEVVLDVTAVDPDRLDEAAAPPVAIDWGDGTTTAGALDAATARASFRHTYRATGKYAAVAAVAGQSGLRGLAGTVLEATAADAAAPRLVGFHQVTFAGVKVFADTAGNFDAGVITASLELAEATGPLAIGAAPEKKVEIKKTMVVDGVETVVNPGLTDLGALVGYNPDRSPGDRLVIRMARRGGTFWDGRNIVLLLRDLQLDLYSPQRGQPVTRTTTLTAATVSVFYADTPMTAEATLAVEPDGTLRIPFAAPRGNGRTPLLDRVEVDVAGLLAGADLGQPALAGYPVGVRRTWAEVRPGVLVAGPVEGLPTPPADAGPDGGAAGDGDGGGCCQGSRAAGGLLPLALVAWPLVRRRRSRR